MNHLEQTLEGEDEEEAATIVLEEEIPRIDRTPYYERHKVLEPILAVLRIRNGVLQKKLAVFFRRRKMEQVLKESDQIYDSQQRYGRKLENLAEMIELDKIQRTTTNNELAELKARKEEKHAQLVKMFKVVQKKEKDTG